MPVELLVAFGVIASLFVAVNVGGSSAGVAFGPATGSDVLSARQAGALMTGSALAGGVALGPRVTETLGEGFVPPAAFSVPVAVGVLAVTGGGILLGNYRGVSVSTSGTAVGAVVGLGAAIGAVDWGAVVGVVGWWLVAAVLAFWLAALIGRYRYEAFSAAIDRADDRTVRAALVVVSCGMGFAAGGSNVANAVGALVGADALSMGPAILLGGAGIGLGAFLLGPRTLATVGEGITDLSVAAALIVQSIAAAIITALNAAAVPASLAVTTTMAVVGLGWGRASRQADGSALSGVSGAGDRGIGRLYDPAVTKRVVSTWLATPAVAGVLAFVSFALAT